MIKKMLQATKSIELKHTRRILDPRCLNELVHTMIPRVLKPSDNLFFPMFGVIVNSMIFLQLM